MVSSNHTTLDATYLPLPIQTWKDINRAVGLPEEYGLDLFSGMKQCPSNLVQNVDYQIQEYDIKLVWTFLSLFSACAHLIILYRRIVLNRI